MSSVKQINCLEKISFDLAPYTPIYSFPLKTNLGGFNISDKFNLQTKPIEINTKLLKSKFFKPKYIWFKQNKGCNDCEGKGLLAIPTCAYKEKKIRIKKKILGQPINVSFTIPNPPGVPTKCKDQLIMYKKEIPNITLFTIPSFKFNYNINVKANFKLDSVFQLGILGFKGIIANSLIYQRLIKDIPQLADFIKDNKDAINKLDDPTDPNYKNNIDVGIRLATLIMANAGEVLLTLVTSYMMKDSLCLSYTINALYGDLYFELDSFEISFGKLHIKIPKFRIEFNDLNLLKDQLTGKVHPITISAGSDGLQASILLYSIEDDFFEVMIKSIEKTIEKFEDVTDYDIDGLKAVLEILNDTNNEVKNWLEKYLGIRFRLDFYGIFCPAAMSATPPTPFILSTRFVLIINPYKILKIIFDAAESIQQATKQVEDLLLQEIKDSGIKHDPIIDDMLKGALDTINDAIADGMKYVKKGIDNKYVNKDMEKSLIINIPIEPA